ncbi:sugar ABC transporter substrate-binding protein [Rhizomonospora bruguierae]|uniref:sugar ABC transporter substrate-binding protein n=1 Tax=Rhizomonospora bruguierae TaxID=1581705 RepID=UPI001BCE3BD0|nr:sugar ABC transporter substrate-binding protein [Micromonospora sp. NBRC 107566]
MKARTRSAATLAALAALTLLVAAGCTGSNEPATPNGSAGADAPAGGGYTFAVVTHASAGDAFWDVVKKGAEAAGKDQGITVRYDGNGDPAQQATLIDGAVSQKVSGLVVSMANPDALREPIAKAVAAGIPVVTINSGQSQSAAFGAIAHVGQDETVAGQGAGGKLAEAGVKHLICVVHEAGNVGLEQRCAGAKSKLGGTVENLQVKISDVAAAQNTISAKLQQDKSIDGVLTLNPAVAMAATAAVKSAGSAAKVATFDLNGDVADAIGAGDVLFAVDQQQYLQGYLPIVMLKLYITNGNTVGGGLPVLTGPGYVTKENVEQVKQLAAAGTR